MAFGARQGINVAEVAAVISVRTGQSGRRVDRLGKKVSVLNKRFMSLRRGAAEMRYGFQNIANSLKPAVFGGMIASGLAIKEAFGFDQQIAGIQSAIGDLKTERPAVERLIKNLALDPTNVTTAIEAAKAYKMLAKSGIKEVTQAAKVMPVILRLAAIDTKLSSEKAAGHIIALHRQFGTSFESIGNSVARAVDTVHVEVGDLMTGMQYATALAKEMGLELEDSLALVTLAIQRGLKPSRAGTSMRQFMTALAKEGKVDYLKKQLGVDVWDPVTHAIKPVGDIIDDLTDALGRLTDKSKVMHLQEIFNVRGFTGVAKLLQATGKGYREIVAAMGKGITLAEKAKRVSEGAMSMLKFLRSALGVIAIDFVKQLFDPKVVGDFAKSVAQVAKAFGMLVDGASDADIAKEKFSSRTMKIAKGIQGAVEGIKKAFAWLGEKIEKVLGWFGLETTEEITTFMVTFAALSPVIMVVGMALMVLFNIVRGVGLILFGAGRIIFGTVIPAFASMVAWSWRLSGALFSISNLKFGLWYLFKFLPHQVKATAKGMKDAAKESRKLNGTWGMLKNAGRGMLGGLKAIGRGLFSILGPTALVYAAIEGISALFDSFSRKADDIRENLGRPVTRKITPEQVGTGKQIYGAFRRARYHGMGLRGAELTPGPKSAPGKLGMGTEKGLENLRLFIKMAEAGITPGVFAQKKLESLGISAERAGELVEKFSEDKVKDLLTLTGQAYGAVVESQDAYRKALVAAKKITGTTWQAATAKAKIMGNLEVKARNRMSEFIDTMANSSPKIIEALRASILQAGAAVAATGLQGGADATEAGMTAAQEKLKKCLESRINLKVGGRTLAGVVSRQYLDLQERGGASQNGYQRHRVIQDGSKPTGMA